MMRHLLVIVLVLCCSWQVSHAKVLGVQRARAAYFDAAKADGSFRCLDGSKIIPFLDVNNDVCDCPDGSDEPGTSACATLQGGALIKLPEDWKFRCTNDGYFEQEFRHSAVNDGICDCCDGSDETTSGVSCPNRCVEVEQELTRQKAEEQKRMQTALVNKASMRKEAIQKWTELTKALPSKKSEREKILAGLPKLETKQQETHRAQEAVREELRVKYAAWEASQAERESEEESSCIKWRQTGGCKADGGREFRFDKDCDIRVPREDSGFCECARVDVEVDAAEGEKTPEDVGSDEGPSEDVDSDDADGDDKNGVDKDGDDEKSKQHIITYGFPCGHKPLTCMYVCDHNGEAGLGNFTERPTDPNTFTTSEATAAQEALDAQRRNLADLDTSIEEATQLLNRTTPTTEDLLRTLEGKVFTMDTQEYTYAVNMFRDVHQRAQGQGSGGQLLGLWKSFAENTYAMWAKDAYDLTQMLYHKGSRCWNGVIRKTDIQLVCGPENKLALVEEPAMCIYRMVFETPAMCEE